MIMYSSDDRLYRERLRELIVLFCILLFWSRLSSLRPGEYLKVVCLEGARGEKPAGGRKKWMCDRVGKMLARAGQTLRLGRARATFIEGGPRESGTRGAGRS